RIIRQLTTPGNGHRPGCDRESASRFPTRTRSGADTRLWCSMLPRDPRPLWAGEGARSISPPMSCWAFDTAPTDEILCCSHHAIGLLIPLMLIPHVFGTRVQANILGIHDDYARQMLIYAVGNPLQGLLQLTLLTVAWVHGWLGIHHWLRAKPAAAATLPVLQL